MRALFCHAVLQQRPDDFAARHMPGCTDGGIIANARAGALLIDSSTIAPQCSQRVAAAAEAAQMTMVDAPVSVRTLPSAAEFIGVLAP